MTVNGMPSVRELSEMIVNAQFTPSKPNVNELVDELLSYLKDNFPRKTAELQIEATIQNRKKKGKRKKKLDENRQKLLNEAYAYAIQLIQQKSTDDLVNTQLKLFYWFDHKGLTLDESYEIIQQAKKDFEIIQQTKKDFEQAIQEKPELKPVLEEISKREHDISTSIETQVESQDEIESRLYNGRLPHCELKPTD
jgi:hypothetical protein